MSKITKQTFNQVQMTTIKLDGGVDLIKFDDIETLSLTQFFDTTGNLILRGEFYGDDSKELVKRAFPNLTITKLKNAGYGYPAKYRASN